MYSCCGRHGIKGTFYHLVKILNTGTPIGKSALNNFFALEPYNCEHNAQGSTDCSSSPQVRT